MKFPGRRKTKHYFPVSDKGRTSFKEPGLGKSRAYIVGIDQLLVDIEIEVGADYLRQDDFEKGQSFLIDDV
jgi:inosine kinase